MSIGGGIGTIGEECASKWLLERGFSIIARNFRKSYGEIDIIAEKDGGTRFIEVKTSKYHPSTSFLPEIRVNSRKIGNLKKICETYLRETSAPFDKYWQIDIISVALTDEMALKSINIFENAIFGEKY